MADQSHKRETNARLPRASVLAGPLALLATATAVSFGVAGSATTPVDLISASTIATDLETGSETVSGSAGSGSGTDVELPNRLGTVSRDLDRLVAQEPTRIERLMARPAVATAIKRARTKLWTTESLNLWNQPGDQAKKLGEIDPETKVLVTGRTLYGREEIVVGGQSRWVTRGYLSNEKPFTLGGECTNAIDLDGISDNLAKTITAVCAEFPEITTYGTLRGGGGDHGSGLAVDIMVSGDRGQQVADFVRKYYSELGVNYVIYAQQIWSVQRSGEGWRGMEDRGSATANHYDHVHVSVF